MEVTAGLLDVAWAENVFWGCGFGGMLVDLAESLLCCSIFFISETECRYSGEAGFQRASFQRL